MAWAYFDTSVLGRSYFSEQGRAEAVKILRGHECITSILTVVEFRSALRRRMTEDVLSSRDAEAVLERFSVDRQGWGLVEITSDVLSGAEDIVATHAVRTIDAVHIASARVVFGRLQADAPRFITADQRQADAARSVGLRVTALA